MDETLATVRAYHERTKHRFDRYAAGPEGLDWASQPDPFRTYTDAAVQRLPLLQDRPDSTYEALYTGTVASAPLTLENLAGLLELSLGLSAWKRYGDTRWALRCNPSSGNLHPTEGYLLSPGLPGLDAGVHHYLSRDHALEHRADARAIEERWRALFPDGCVLLALSSVHWREEWKYGERAWRYCQHDVGHAVAALRYAAAAFGWQLREVSGWSDTDIARLLGLGRDRDYGAAEREAPDLLLVAGPQLSDDPAPALADLATECAWHGSANVLSTEHLYQWPVIEEAAHAATRPRQARAPWTPALTIPLASHPAQIPAATIFRQRRSAQGFDGTIRISRAEFYRMLDATLPRPARPPFDALPWEPRLHFALFVHRVDGLKPGLYFLVRRTEALAELKMRLRAEFAWETPEDCPAHLPLFRLVTADARNAAKTLSCHQEIASDSAFSLGMIAEFESTLTQVGPWAYRELFWEAGMIGQVLYLEAEAAGVRGTGIGCFFDDGVHEVLGIGNTALQSLYHFTVGGPVADTRLETLPPYADR